MHTSWNPCMYPHRLPAIPSHQCLNIDLRNTTTTATDPVSYRRHYRPKRQRAVPLWSERLCIKLSTSIRTPCIILSVLLSSTLWSGFDILSLKSRLACSSRSSSSSFVQVPLHPVGRGSPPLCYTLPICSRAARSSIQLSRRPGVSHHEIPFPVGGACFWLCTQLRKSLASPCPIPALRDYQHIWPEESSSPPIIRFPWEIQLISSSPQRNTSAHQTRKSRSWISCTARPLPSLASALPCQLPHTALAALLNYIQTAPLGIFRA